MRFRSITLSMALAAFAPFVAKATDPLPDSRLDPRLSTEGARRANVFVLLDRQLFLGGGDFEKFAEANKSEKRSQLRTRIISRLRQNHEQSYGEITPLVQNLRKQRLLRGLERRWIVNGFSAEVPPKALAELIKHPTVRFIYRLPGTKKKKPAGGKTAQILKSAAQDWKNDSENNLELEKLKTPWNIQRIKADRVWRQSRLYGGGVTIAVNDGGIAPIDALLQALWRNPKEEINGVDDDGNGYVDDVFGYDFRQRSANVLNSNSHGTACAGIIASRPINSRTLATGIAPRARIMPLIGGMDIELYQYALEHGADIMSLSFMGRADSMGEFRGLVRLLHENITAAGVLCVGGAGNYGPGSRRRWPVRLQIGPPKDIPCVVAVAGTLRDGIISAPSSRGPCIWEDVTFYSDHPSDRPLQKPDLTALFGGYPIWHVKPISPNDEPEIRLPHSQNGKPLAAYLDVGPMGNSFSGPHAAGIAALMLSANPDLNPWTLKRLMQATAKDLGKPGWDPIYGHGLLDASEAVEAAIALAK